MKAAIVARVCLGRALRHYRRKAGLEQWKAGDILGIDQSGYSKYERGAVPLPAHALMLMSPHLDTSPSDMMHYANILYEEATSWTESGWKTTPKALAQWADEVLNQWDDDLE